MRSSLLGTVDPSLQSFTPLVSFTTVTFVDDDDDGMMCLKCAECDVQMQCEAMSI